MGTEESSDIGLSVMSRLQDNKHFNQAKHVISELNLGLVSLVSLVFNTASFAS